MVYNRIRLTQWMSILLSCVLLLGWNLGPAHAEPAAEPVVTYVPNTNNSITIGSDTGAAPASEVLTFSALKTKLDALGGADRLIEQGSGAWLLKANILIKATASLQIIRSDPSLTTLQMESLPFKAVYIQIEKGGQLLLNGITVTSWDTAANKPDETITDQRSYIDAVDGARMDILNSDVGYLGSSSGAGNNGLTWRKRLIVTTPATGATGLIDNSKIHHNFVGIYVSSGYGLKITNKTDIYSNLNEGLLVKDESQNIEVATSDVHNNGTDGMNFVSSSELNIHNNKVYANGRQGILLGGGSNNNLVDDNEAYGHTIGDGIAVAVSNGNIISRNRVHDNKSGIRVSGSTSIMATSNQIVTNTVTANDNGINLYSHADRNVIRNNQVAQNKANGIYIKSGGNRLERNTITTANATGIGISADLPDNLAGAEVSGSNNVIVGSTITGNAGVGIKITGGGSNRIGLDPQAPNTSDSNLIEGNTGDGVAMSVGTNSGIGTTDTLVYSNTLRDNANAVSVTGAGSLRNRISHNLMTANRSNAIKVSAGAQGGIQLPVITAVLADNEVQGTAVAGGVVEVYTDPAGQAQTFWGSATVGSDGKWKFQLPVGQDPKKVTALVIDQNGNTSPVSARSGSTAGPFYKVENDADGQTTIFATGNGAQVTFNTIKTGLGAANTNLLNDLGNGLWELNANMMIAAGVTLDLSQAAGVKELRLRSQASVPVVGNAPAASDIFDLRSFVYLRTHDGTINIDGVKIYSWDSSANAPDTDTSNGRAYIVAKYTAQMFITNSELSHLGSPASTDTYGVTWRDSNDPLAPGTLRTRVTGQASDSKFHHNHIGAYATQAQDMLFKNNEFYENSLYGLNIDDFSKAARVENNRAHTNLSHGFFFSRGVATATILGNQSYKNLTHGFVIDAGSATADIPATPSTDNTFEKNAAYENQGLGMKIVESNNNIVHDNQFYNNVGGGISIEKKSTANRIEGNQLTENKKNGLELRDTADANIVASNVISKNLENGLYVRSSNNTLNSNRISGNQKAGAAFTSETSVAVQNNQFIGNMVFSNLTSGVDVRNATNTKIEANKIYNNSQHGVYLTIGATNSLVTRNEIYNNVQYGIRCSDLSAFSNKWSENSLYANGDGGVIVTDGANSSISPAVSLAVKLRVLTGSAQPGATVEVFTDDNGQGRYYHGNTVVEADGKFSFTLISGKWTGAQIITVVIDAQSNASRFSSGISAPNVPDNVFMPIVRR